MLQVKVKRKKRIPQWLLPIVIIFFIVALLTTGAYFAFTRYYQNKFYPNIILGNTNIGGLTLDQANDLLNKQIDRFNQNGIIFSYQGQEAVLTPLVASVETDLAYSVFNFNVENSAKLAFAYGRNPSFLIALNQKINSILYKKHFDLLYDINNDEVKKTLTNNFSDLAESAQDARLTYAASATWPYYHFNVSAEAIGEIIEYNYSLKLLEAQLAKLDNAPIELSVKADYPKIYKKELIELLFEQPYSKIDFVVRKLNVERKAASRYLKKLNEAGILKSENTYYVIGKSNSLDGDISYNHGAYDLWFLIIDTIGNIVSEKTFGGTYADGGFVDIAKLNDTTFYITAQTKSLDGDISNNPWPGHSNIWTLQINKQGDILWESVHGGSFIDWTRDMEVTSDGGLLSLGITTSVDGDISNPNGDWDLWLIKLNSSGETEWDFSLGSAGGEEGGSVIQTSDGGYIVIGNTDADFGAGGGNYDTACNYNGFVDAWVVKLDSLRNIEWQQTYGGTYIDACSNILETNDGYICLAVTMSNDGDVSGNHSDPYGNNYDIWYVKLSSTGELLSQQCFGGVRSEGIEFGVLKKNDYNYVIAGTTNSSYSYDVQCSPHGDYTDEDFWVFEIKDCNYYASAVPEIPQGADTVCTTENTQTVFSVPPAEKAFYYEWHLSPEEAGTVSGDSLTATVSWAQDFTGTAAVVVRSVNDCGESNWSQPHLVQVYSCIGIHEQQTEGMTLKVYPNPAKDFIIFELQGKENTGTIRIMNIFGETAATKKVSPDKTAVRFAGLESGIYFYRLESGGKVLSGKFIVSK